ncbi:uncharacterized protein C8Q71DRAFT_226682 [Rhodofomes roseus]|uniref:Uncharacterized protein n=1 Tax=Rhodofomes roseus TaxID=34475 RepID=A0ABQ8KV45_9APHY|nr:uncharacterized protein C8Q71DRAFT_226682 [Rhodofomes roseus]KAH9842898.1 hypothetical protein C8Q71DRAFT_226682 [Rhodofomes roseus]
MASRPTPAGDISTTHAIQPTVQLTCLVAMSSIIAEVMSRYVGVAFFGCTFVAFLSGITTAQFLVFRASEVVDHRVLRSLVSCLWVVDGVHSALVSWPAYAWAVSDRSNVLGVLYGNVWSFRVSNIYEYLTVSQVLSCKQGAALLTGISNLGVRR